MSAFTATELDDLDHENRLLHARNSRQTKEIMHLIQRHRELFIEWSDATAEVRLKEKQIEADNLTIANLIDALALYREFFEATINLSATLGHPDATPFEEGRAERRYAAAKQAVYNIRNRQSDPRMVSLSAVLDRLEQGFGANSGPVTVLKQHFGV